MKESIEKNRNNQSKRIRKMSQEEFNEFLETTKCEMCGKRQKMTRVAIIPVVIIETPDGDETTVCRECLDRMKKFVDHVRECEKRNGIRATGFKKEKGRE